MNNISRSWLCVGLFAVTRVYIWVAKPIAYSQITAVYMPYAHLWDSGVKPYLQQWYEYPPATIPLFYLPHLIDKSTMNWVLHINYGYAYRGIIFLVDLGIFWLIWKTITKFKVAPRVWMGSLIYYSLATAKAHDFIYDSMDLVFVAAIAFGIVSPWLFKRTGYFWGWIGYFLAVSLKLINAPLGAIYATLERKNIKKLTLNLALAGLTIWLIPAAFYRSSLMVMWVYHAGRGLQVESVPAQIAAVLNSWTQTEKYEVLYQSVNITGPISTQLTKAFNGLLGLFVVGFLVGGVKSAWNIPAQRETEAKIILTLFYLFGFMIFGKVLSTPYLLWQIPLLALYPYKNLKQQLGVMIPSFLMIAISMTQIPNTPLGIFNLHLIIGVVRACLLIYLAGQMIKIWRQLV